MTKHNGYDLVRPMFTSGKLKAFSDIFNFDLLPKTRVAEDLGKEKGRFNKLIENPNGFLYGEIRKFSIACHMEPYEIGILIENEHPWITTTDAREKAEKYAAIKPMVEQKQITLLEDIFKYIPKYTIAREIGRKGTTLDRYIKNLANFPIEDIRAIGALFDLSLADMLKLVEAQFAK